MALSSKKAFIIFYVIVLALSVARTPLASSATSDSQDKALSFLKDVIHLDMSRYTVTLAENDSRAANDGGFFIQLRYDLFSFESVAKANIHISDGTLTSCSLYVQWGRLLFADPSSDSFESAKGIMERYQTWLNDSNVEEMSNLLAKVGSARNVTETSDNVTLRISILNSYSSYTWKNTINGAEYSGVSLYFSSRGLNFDFQDDRTIRRIGNTDINISKEQAISIAKTYVENYSYFVTFSNGTKIQVNDLNVTDAGTRADLHTATRGNSTLYPLWNVQVQLDHLYLGNTKAIYVGVWAGDGTVSQAYRVANVSGFDPLSLIFLPIIGNALFSLLSIVAGGIALSIALLIFVRMNKRKKIS